MTMPDDLRAYNRQLIAEFRADGGRSIGDRALLLLTTTGRKSGRPHTAPMMYVRSPGGRLMVIASNAGAASDPAWFRNLQESPSVTVEMPGETFAATATPLTGDEYDREWAHIKEQVPFFADHERKAGGRRIPVVVLTPGDQPG